jgi:hypothetical protein
MPKRTKERPPPHDSLRELRAYIEEKLAEAPIRRRGRPQGKARVGREESGLTPVVRYLDVARLYAWPSDKPDWKAIARATRHRQSMKSGQFPSPSPSSPRLRGFRNWEYLGPRNFDPGDGRYVSGRVNAIAIDPRDSATAYAGSAGGGVWKTTDRGKSWAPLSNPWPHEEVSSVAIDPSNSSIIYAGTGDFPNWGARSFGVMKSSDGGATWTNFGAAELGDIDLNAIVVHPDDPAVVLTCGGRGPTRYGMIWRSTNGGLSWALAYTVGAEWAQMAVSGPAGGRRAVYATGWNASGGVLARSFTGGETWDTLNPPWGSGQWGTGVAASPTEPGRLYLLAGKDRKIYTSPDFGDHWDDVTDDLRRDDFEWAQLYYDWAFACGSSGGASPHDVLLLGLLHLNEWDSSRRTWIAVPHGHDDVHAIAVDPSDVNRFLIGNDGGVFELTRIAGGWDINSLNVDLGTTQSYRGGATPFDPRIFLAAMQDNAVGSAQTGFNSWAIVWPPVGGDAVAAAVHPQDPQVQFAEGGVDFYGIGRTSDRWGSQSNITPSLQGDFLDPFSMPIVMDGGGTRLYWGTDYLWIRDEASGTWSAQVGGQKLAGKGSGVRVIAVAPSNRDFVYTGSTDGQLWMGTGPAWRWTRIDDNRVRLPNRPPRLPSRQISAISVHPYHPNDILVAVGGTGSGHVWRCRDTSATQRVWEDLSGSGADALPDVPAVGIVRDPRRPSDTLYVGTDIGVFGTEKGGAEWFDLTIPHGLPAAQLSELQLVGRTLYAVTFGRGVWRHRLPLTQSTPASASIDHYLFVATTSIDGRILLCQARLGQAFSDWRPIAGNGRTDAPVALAAVQNTLFVFCKGVDGRIYVNQAELTTQNTDPEKFARSFGGWFEVGDGRSDAAPAATSVAGSVFVFVKGLDGRIYANQAEYRHAFSDWFEVQGDGHTDAAPAAAAIDHSVFVFVKGTNGRIYVNQAEFGHRFNGWFEVQGDGRTDAAPAATAIDHSVFVFVKGTNGRIYVNQAEFGHAFSGWFEVQGNGMTGLAPAASSVLRSVFAFVLGLDGAISVNQAEYQHAFSGWLPMGDEAS